jgi:chromosome segregation ATPase
VPGACATARDANAVRSDGKESVRAFVARKREIFLVQMDIDNKLKEIGKLEAQAARREEALKKSERMLEEDHARFDEFLKENDAKVREAVNAAEREARAKREKMKEMKRLQNDIASATQELNRKEEKLKECYKYKEFLDALTPSEWLEQHAENDAAMYFTQPEQLLRAFAALEEQNLFLIQSVREAEEMLQTVQSKHTSTKTRMETEMTVLREQIRQLQEAIDAEEHKGQRLSQQLNGGDTGDEDEVENELKELTKRVTEVYVDCGFDHDPSIGVLQMLTNIEAKMEEYFATIDTLPQDVVADLEKRKEKERRRLAREERAHQLKREQELRFQRSLERARAPAHKKTGKPVMFRSNLPSKRVVGKESDANKITAAAADRELEDFLARQY